MTNDGKGLDIVGALVGTLTFGVEKDTKQLGEAPSTRILTQIIDSDEDVEIACVYV